MSAGSACYFRMIIMENTKKTVAAIGKFDGFHIGHRELMKTAIETAKQKDRKSLIFFIGNFAGLNHNCKFANEYALKMGFDEYLRQELSKDFMNLDAESFVKDILKEKLGCSHVVVGYNFRFAKDRSADADMLKDICKNYGIECIVVDEVKLEDSNGNLRTVSSSFIRTLIAKGDMKETQKFLGRPYSVRGNVQKGRQLGGEMGFPTANLSFPATVPLPPFGVYASRTNVCGEKYLSITNIGNNPTVSPCAQTVTVETNIFDFSSDIYGEEITVEFLGKVRDEIRFESLDALTEQVLMDKKCVMENFDLDNNK